MTRTEIASVANKAAAAMHVSVLDLMLPPFAGQRV
jgi:hypothetical protein